MSRRRGGCSHGVCSVPSGVTGALVREREEWISARGVIGSLAGLKLSRDGVFAVADDGGRMATEGLKGIESESRRAKGFAAVPSGAPRRDWRRVRAVAIRWQARQGFLNITSGS